MMSHGKLATCDKHACAPRLGAVDGRESLQTRREAADVLKKKLKKSKKNVLL
jgi:hypothetical protein